MESVLTVRLDADIKAQGTAVMNRLGLTPSQAVRKFFDFVASNDALPFIDEPSQSEEELTARLQAFDNCHTKNTLRLTDTEIREARLRERYGFDA